MEIAIIGAGAMGCLYGFMLGKKNHVTLYDANPEAVRAIRQNGVTVCEQDQSSETVLLACKQSGDCDRAVDLVIVFVKSTVSEAAVAANRKLMDDHTILLSLQNGMGNGEILKHYADESHILLGTSKHNSVVVDYGKIFHSGSGVTVIGSPSGCLSAAEKAIDCFRRSNIETEISQSVNHLLWKKLFVNLTLNPITALFEDRIGLVLQCREAEEMLKDLLREAVAVARADGEDFDCSVVSAEVRSIARKLSDGYTSMCQDIRNGRKTEIDFINGAVSEIGKRYNLPTPCNDMITKLIHIKELAGKERA